MKRLLGLAVIASLVWACGGPSTSTAPSGSAENPPAAEASPTPNTGLCTAKTPEEATFTFWTFVDRHATWWQKRADEWNTANPDKQITLNCSVIAYQQMHDNLAAAFTAGIRRTEPRRHRDRQVRELHQGHHPPGRHDG